jgi:hypothetical protein
MIRPRVKPDHVPYPVSGRRIMIGHGRGMASDLTDADAALWTLLGCMDGTRSVREIVKAVIAAHPEESPGTVRRAITRLINLGFVEDAAGPVPRRNGRAPRRGIASGQSRCT